MEAMKRTARNTTKLYVILGHTLLAALLYGGLLIVSPGLEAFATSSTTTVSCTPNPVFINETTTCTATVSVESGGATPTGTVTFDDGGKAGSFTDPAPVGECTLSSGSCSVTYVPAAGDAGTTTITGNYSGDGNHPASSGTFSLTVLRATTTTVTCSETPLVVNEQTICTATVTDTSPGTPSFPTGTVTFSNSPASEGSFDTTSCTLNAVGQCTVNYTPSSGDTATHTITASYGGSGIHGSSSDTFDQAVVKRAADLLLSCTPVDIFINQQLTCTVTVKDDTTVGTAATPTGDVSFDDGGKAGTFSGAPCTLSSGSCSVNYTPAAGDAGTSFATTTITASYGGSSVHQTSSDTNQLIVSLRTTTTEILCLSSRSQQESIFVNETASCTVTVKDIAPAGDASAPTGSVTLTVTTTGTGGTFTISDNTCGSLTADTTDKSSCTFQYTPTSLEVDAGFHTLEAVYNGSTTHSGSGSGFGLGIMKRKTQTTVECVDDASPSTCTVTVAEDSTNRGTPSTPAGTIVAIADIPGGVGAGEDVCTLSGGTCTFNVSPAAILVNVPVRYEPSDSVHLKSIGSDNITAPDSSLPTSPTGAKNVAEIIHGLNAGCLAAEVTALALETTQIFTDLIPDSVVVALVTGTTIPVSDLLAAIFGLARVVLQTFVLAACTDLDGDGLPGVVEQHATETSDSDFDSDDDGLGDGDEIFTVSAGGFFGGTPPACPSPTDFDSDDDTLNDGFEDEGIGTDFCDKDDDDDGLPDTEYTITMPLDPDTDDDGLCDGDGAVDVDGDGTNGCPVGFNFSSNTSTGVTRSEASAGTNPKNPDTDGDEILDGAEDRDGDGVFGATCSAPPSPGGDCTGEGEPDPTKFDTDNDGLSDGFELGSGSGCDPADPDTDNDGLSDSEEQNRTFTTCSEADTDGDGLDDYDEVFILGGTFPDRQFDQESDPLDPDTDDDGLCDGPNSVSPVCTDGPDGNGEFGPNGTDGGTTRDTVCPFVNDDDSDNDARQDGVEATEADVSASLGNSGELNDDNLVSICDSDSDGDGLGDGAEVAIGTNHLDWDSDNDGLSDREEIQIYFTNPNNADTDGDTADGVIAARAPASIPVLSGHSGNGTIACLSDCEEALSATAQFNNPPNPLDETDPLQIDTDGDGINDNIEFNPGCNDGPGGPGTGAALFDGFANSFDSDADGLRDREDAVADLFTATGVNNKPVSRAWQTFPETPTPSPGGSKTAGADGINDGELNDDALTGICDPDSDGDGVLDGAEHQIGSDPFDWDTDDDGRDDREFLGGGPIPTDPLDFDTDDDGLGDGVEVNGSNPTNPVNADTDGDGLCDGGANTPAAQAFGGAGVDGAGKNLLCKSGTGISSVGQIGDHPNPLGLGEDEDGDGDIADVGVTETDPNQFDTDGDAEGDGVEKLGFSTSRQFMIPAIDLRGRPINVTYPATGCMDPLDPDTDDDGLEDGFEDFNHDGNWDFLPSDFDHEDPLPGPVRPEPEETNPCDADSDDDGLNDFLERNQPNPPAVFPFNPTNPLDHDTDNDLMFDGEEVFFVCAPAPAISNLDNDGDGAVDEDPIDGIDNDLDGKIDEDKPDFTVFHIDFLDPTNRDSDFDGFIDGLDPDPCNSPLIPILEPFLGSPPPDTDKDGFADEDELAAGTDPNDPDDHPTAFPADLDRDGEEDDRLWLEDPDKDGVADTVALDVNSNSHVDARIEIIQARDFARDDFDGDGAADDCRYRIVYAFANQRVLQPRIVLTIFDFDCDLVIDKIEFEKAN